MSYSITIEVPTMGTDANRRRGKHWTQLKKTNDAIKSMVRVKTINSRPEKPLKKFSVAVIRYGAKCLDYDNFISSLKPYIDSLKHSGIIFDDGWDFIQQISTNQIISTERKLVITVTEREA